MTMKTLKISDQAHNDMIREVVEYGGSWAFMRDNEDKDKNAHDVVMTILKRFIDDQMEQRELKNEN